MNPNQGEQPGAPRVTALIVTRDSANQLAKCLEALERSDQRKTIEILVVDNGSSDDTPAVLSRFPEIQTMRLPKDFGHTKATNIGMRTAKGDYLFFLPANVEVQPDTVTKLSLRLDASDAVGAVCPHVDRWFRMPDVRALTAACQTGELPNPQPISTTEGSETPVEYVPGSPMMVRRLFLRGMNYLDERFGDHWSDLELCWQFRNAGKSILVQHQVVVATSARREIDADAIHRADCLNGAAAFLSKHFGAGPAFKFRLNALLGALGKGDLRLLSPLLSGSKIDGTHLA